MAPSPPPDAGNRVLTTVDPDPLQPALTPQLCLRLTDLTLQLKTILDLMKARIDCSLVIVNIYYQRYLAGRAIIAGEAGGVAVGWNNDRQDNHIHHVCVNTGETRGRGSRGSGSVVGRSLAWSVAKHNPISKKREGYFFCF